MIGISKKQPLKRSQIGLEVEVFTLDHAGNVVDKADALIKKVSPADKSIFIKKECAHNMVEMGSFPSTQIPNSIANLLKNMESVLLHAEKLDLHLYPLGTYPGKFTPKMRGDTIYRIKESIFGKKRFEIAGRCIGFHYHYALPWGVFDARNLSLKQLIQSKNKQSLVNSYNLLIAMDPILTTFMQSSPFYQGKQMGKDSREIMYRGGKALRCPEGLYANFTPFGGLQAYKYTGTDLIHYITNKYRIWRKTLKNLGINLKVLGLYGSILDTTWNPVKVNANGTLEQRGMDMNHPSLILGISTVMKSILQKVQQDFIQVLPSDIGMKEPFKLEKNTIYIPPDSYVRTTMQRNAAYRGLESRSVYIYCKRLLKLVHSLTSAQERKFLRPFDTMIKDRMTLSDHILAQAAKRGYKEGDLPQQVAADIALSHERRLYKDIVVTRKMVENAG